eukprot:80726-Alexandrium_andersonii.AAC.1
MASGLSSANIVPTLGRCLTSTRSWGKSDGAMTPSQTLSEAELDLSSPGCCRLRPQSEVWLNQTPRSRGLWDTICPEKTVRGRR